MNLELKDVLYYSDLIYEIKKLAGFEQEKNEEVETRILKRHEGIVEEQENGPFRFLERLSAFQQELFEIVMGISKKAGVAFRGLREISKYPELVNEVLTELEIKKNSIETENKNEIVNDGPKLVKKLVPPTSNN